MFAKVGRKIVFISSSHVFQNPLHRLVVSEFQKVEDWTIENPEPSSTIWNKQPKERTFGTFEIPLLWDFDLQVCSSAICCSLNKGRTRSRTCSGLQCLEPVFFSVHCSKSAFHTSLWFCAFYHGHFSLSCK